MGWHLCLAADRKFEYGLVLVGLPWAQDRAGEIRAIDGVRRKLGFQTESAMFGVGVS